MHALKVPGAPKALPPAVYPIYLQATAAESLVQPTLQTVPHFPL